jgi:mannose-6-phosphate isomerase-like protein (cupin superfamily)
MANFFNDIQIVISKTITDKKQTIREIVRSAELAGYTVVDIDDSRPWGGFVRFDYKDGDNFIHEFFPDVDPVKARLGNPDAELSPKILIVEPGQRLSWQMHHRRAERWVFLTAGGYYKSTNPDDMGELIAAAEGEVVQFEPGECHRLVGAESSPTFVAEIWQHTEVNQPSDEDDIIRLQDDYKR